MKLCPPWPDIEMMLTIDPSIFSRFMIASASCIRKKGARTLIANIASKSSGLVSQMVPRSVMPAEFTRMSTRPNAMSASATTLRVSSIDARSAATKTVLTPFLSSANFTLAPRSALRPVMTRPAMPRSANR